MKTDLINITTKADINESMKYLLAHDKEAAQPFGTMFYSELTEDSKKLYHHIFPKKKNPQLAYHNYDAPASATDHPDYF